ncbi:hypothetical protein RRG08_052422 [Elysia crispata]|uniref:Uncharacterized protein n=1 Tax=Elysia crispata TaxID=231223 RepID=A0AAE1E8G0_9GAST|nr:hypothetical protein RRG08_052422 [Elysia crispata]
MWMDVDRCLWLYVWLSIWLSLKNESSVREEVERWLRHEECDVWATTGNCQDGHRSNGEIMSFLASFACLDPRQEAERKLLRAVEKELDSIRTSDMKHWP